ncbi:HD domain-containing protein [Candidatus Parcubacteria bacterium]|nr:MAG: HD domain-containing protein [Candidatus Parcubacteria bacterium]
MRTIIEQIARAAYQRGWRVFVVGGWVRDLVLGRPSKDIDLEVFGAALDDLHSFLIRFGEVNQVGRSFGVFKLRMPDGEIDVALPRREAKTGQGHKGFAVIPDPHISPREAASRRDFTFNGLMYDPLDGKILDYFGGIQDLNRGILRHIGPRFSDDPLRVLRGFQFAGRFNLRASASLLPLCRELRSEYATLPKERIWEEWRKWGERSVCPSQGLRFLNDSGWIEFYPELAALMGVQQEPKWHPEGDVWMHTMHAVDAAVRIASRENVRGEDRLVLVLAVLCHDMGKPLTTLQKGGKWSAPGHPEAGVLPASRFLGRIGAPRRIIERVIPLVKEHMAHATGGEITQRMVRRLALRLKPATIREWAMVVEADHSGRPPLPGGVPAAARDVLQAAERENLSSAQPVPILRGKHLIGLGFQPGPEMGRLLRRAFQAQIEGEFNDLSGALAWVQEKGDQSNDNNDNVVSERH